MFILFYYLLDVEIIGRFLIPVRGDASIYTNLGTLLTVVLNFILGVGAFLMFLFLIIGGLRYIFSGGDEKAIASARGQITVAIAGFLVLLLSWVIMKIIEFFTGLEIVTG